MLFAWCNKAFNCSHVRSIKKACWVFGQEETVGKDVHSSDNVLQWMIIRDRSEPTLPLGTRDFLGDDDASKSDTPIKLLKLFPGQHNDTLGGELITRDNENYEALSYYWGPKVPSPPEIRILAQNEWTSLPITRSLESALRHLRYEKKERKLWVDALYIDQENDVEKSEQIPIMGRTYGQATNVCVWLGPESETSPLAFVQIRRILDLQTFDRLVDEQHTRDWAALSQLMRRPWFSRRGAEIAQLFKQDKSFGHRADFLRDAEALGANRLVQTIGKLFRKADDGQRLEKLLSLESLVSNLSAFNAAKPHDIIYAVLSLANDTITSAKASESFRQRRVSITGPLARPTYIPEQGLQMSGAKFSNEELERRHTSKRNEGPTGEQDGEHGDNAWSASAVTQDTLQSRGFPADLVKRITCLGFKQEEALEALQEEDGDVDRACDRLNKEKETKGKVLKIWQNKVENKTFHVDYKNKKFYEVCEDFLTFIIKSSKSLDMLCRPWAPDPEDPPLEGKGPLPSWICTLSHSPFRPRPDGNFGRVNADLLVGMPDAGGRVYSASANTRPESAVFGEGRDHQSLFVHGFVLDEIEEIRMPAIEGNVPHAWLELGGWSESTTTDPPESFWRTLVADRDEKGRNPPTYYKRACKHAFAQRVERGSLNTERLIGNEDSKIMSNFLRRVQAVVWMRSLIKTNRDGQLGLAPNGARVGDFICIVRGCSVPVVVREVVGPGAHLPAPWNSPHSKRLLGDELQPSMNGMPPHAPMSPTTVSNPAYKFEKQVQCHLIGECYIHGMMDGEAFKVRDSKGIKEWEFELQ